MAETVTRSQHMEITCMLLLQLHNPKLVGNALISAAKVLHIPDAEHAVEILLQNHGLSCQPNNQPVAVPATGVVEDSAKKKKAKRQPRQVVPYNVFVMWFSDFAAHYGRHPAILKFKAENPATKLGPESAAAFQKTLSSELVETIKSVLKPFCLQQPRQQKEGGDTMLQAYKKYVEQHPEADLGRILSLEADPQYKTDPAEMKAQAAEARRLAQATQSRPPAPTATDANKAPDVTMIDQGHQTPAPSPMQTPATVNKTEKVKEKSKRKRDEDAEAAPKEKKVKAEGAEGEKKAKDDKAKEETDGGKVEGAEVKKEKKEKKEKGEKRKEKEEKHKEKSEKQKDKGDKHKKGEEKRKEKKHDRVEKGGDS